MTTQALLFGFLGITMATIVVAFLSILWGSSRRPYLLGLMAALGAYTVVVLAMFVLTNYARPDIRLAAVFLPAFVEEAFRVAIIFGSLSLLSRRRDMVGFGFGYALLESLAKVADLLVLTNRHQLPLGEAAPLLVMPAIPLALLVFLSVLATQLAQRGWRPIGAYLALVTLHALHNGFVLYVLPQDAPLGPSYIAGAVAFYALLTLVVLYWPEPQAPVTIPSPHANRRHDED